MIYTSYFAKSAKETNAVSIARYAPSWFKGREILDLAPKWSLVRAYKAKKINDGDYTLLFNNILSKLDPNIFGKTLDGKILLCWERPEKFCHRHLVSQWLRNAGFKAEEIK